MAQMSLDLVNERESTHFTVYVWDQTLALARMYGWKPAGTQEPTDWVVEEEGRVWNGGYISNSGQKVTAEDAGRLADALERGLDDIPDSYAAWHKADEGRDGGPLIPVGQNLSPLEALSGENTSAIIEFIAFCRRGAFEIQ
jgi:hypothetical protein